MFIETKWYIDELIHKILLDSEPIICIKFSQYFRVLNGEYRLLTNVKEVSIRKVIFAFILSNF
jgi:hypothetical protein